MMCAITDSFRLNLGATTRVTPFSHVFEPWKQRFLTPPLGKLKTELDSVSLATKHAMEWNLKFQFRWILLHFSLSHNQDLDFRFISFPLGILLFAASTATMSRSDGPHRPFLPIGNPFKMMMPKTSHLPSTFLIAYEKNLAKRFQQLKPNHPNDILTFSWMKSALASICETLHDIKKLIVDLELPICSWDIKWVDMYLNNSLNLLDFCSAYGTDIVRQRFGYVMLKCALLDLESNNQQKLMQASSSLHEWRQYQNCYDNSKLQECCDVISKLEETLNLPKIKNTPKAKDLVRAMYGLKVQTMFIFSTFVAAFSTFRRVLVELQVPKVYLWQESFTDVQSVVNSEIKNVYGSGRVSPLIELRRIEENVKKLYPLLHDGLGDVKQEVFKNYCCELMENNEKFLMRLDDLKSEMDCFFKVVVDGRTALLDNFQLQPPTSGVQQVRM